MFASDLQQSEQKTRISLDHFSLKSYLATKARNSHPLILFQGFRLSGKTTHAIDLLCEQPNLFDLVLRYAKLEHSYKVAPQFWEKCVQQDINQLDMGRLNNIIQVVQLCIVKNVNFRAVVMIEDLNSLKSSKFIGSPQFMQWLLEAKNNNITVMMSSDYMAFLSHIAPCADIIFQTRECSADQIEKLWKFPFYLQNKKTFKAALKFYTIDYGALVAIKHVIDSETIYEYMWHRATIERITDKILEPHCYSDYGGILLYKSNTNTT